jgi:hypothetical protein
MKYEYNDSNINNTNNMVEEQIMNKSMLSAGIYNANGGNCSAAGNLAFYPFSKRDNRD